MEVARSGTREGPAADTAHPLPSESAVEGEDVTTPGRHDVSFTGSMPVSRFMQGNNVIAVVVHRRPAVSLRATAATDVLFGMELMLTLLRDDAVDAEDEYQAYGDDRSYLARHTNAAVPRQLLSLTRGPYLQLGTPTSVVVRFVTDTADTVGTVYRV